MIFQKVQETIASHNLIKSDEHIVLGLSGGPDSVCLFHILLRLRQTLGIRLHPVHVNHGLRPGAAERDQNYVEELCREHGASCKVIAANCRELAGAWHMTSEEAGRKLRYDAFYDEARQIAEKLGLPQISYAAEIVKEGNEVTVKRMLEDGYMKIKVQTPCLITCISDQDSKARYMTLNGINHCYEKPYLVLDFEALKDEPLIELDKIGLKGSPTNIFKSFTPPQKGVGTMLEGADKNTAETLANILLEKHVI